MTPAIKAMAKIPSPKREVATWSGSQKPLKIGLTVMDEMGIVEEIIIKKTEKGTTNEPKTVILNFR
jgi:hypothetical protein